MSVKRMSSLLGATALMSLGLNANAGGLSSVVDAEDLAVSQLTELTTISGSTSNGAYSIAPEWSEELGASVSGSFGYMLDEQSALGMIVTAGERKREALLNFGLTIDAERQIIFSAGQLQEQLEYGTAGDQEWVKQSEFGIAYDATAYSVNAFHVDSETTDNFVGSKSTGVEVAGSVDLSAVATLDYAAGYERLQWDDASADEEGLTARLDVAYAAAPDAVVNVFADHNVSENQYGIGATWQLGAGNLNATYTYVDGLVGSITDDSRVSLAFTMPLGGGVASTDAPVATVSSSGLVSARSNDLLAEVMKRPEYLPQRAIVRGVASSGSVISVCGPENDAVDPYAIMLGQFGHHNPDGYVLYDFQTALGAVDLDLYSSDGVISYGDVMGTNTLYQSYYNSNPAGIVSVDSMITDDYQGDLIAYWVEEESCQAGYFAWDD